LIKGSDQVIDKGDNFIHLKCIKGDNSERQMGENYFPKVFKGRQFRDKNTEI